MASPEIPVLMITANVGSIFEDPENMLKIWSDEFLKLVEKSDPVFIALHCQEVGGKNYENSMKHVSEFVDLLTTTDEMQLYNRVRIFLDEDYSSAENFTALGNFYFVHDCLDKAEIWNFKELKFEPVNEREVFSGNIEFVPTKEKAKFPQNYFPECKWSRKGFLRTRWSLNNTVFDMINIHLFHDASNFVAMESFPSVYSKNRRKALEYVLHRFHNDSHGTVPFFLFGDFNFRPDTKSVIKNLTEGLTATPINQGGNSRSGDNTKLEYNNGDNELILCLGKKEFNHSDHQNVFHNPKESWLKPYDKELEAFKDRLTEFPINFPPSYPFEEKISSPTTYMRTRCPAWCDRILLSLTARKLVCDDDSFFEYNILGANICMGDHKPVYLKVSLSPNSGIVKCCEHASSAECMPANCLCYHPFSDSDNPSLLITINVTDYTIDHQEQRTMGSNHRIIGPETHVIDSNLLQEPSITREMLKHDPYTPESTDSHSPNPTLGERGKNLEQDRKGSVAPEQLKTRLENILRFERETRERLKKKHKMQSKMTRSVSQTVDVGEIKCDAFRNRAMSDLPKRVPRLRLISSASIQSTLRLQSHHSSSDEEWFESESSRSDVRDEEDNWETLEKDNKGDDEIKTCEVLKMKKEKIKCGGPAEKNGVETNQEALNSSKILNHHDSSSKFNCIKDGVERRVQRVRETAV